jgi:hypothetical protein
MKSNVSNLDSLLLSQDSSQSIPSINLKCRDAKLFEQFFSSITSTDRSLIIDELHHRDPLLLNELFNNTISSFIEQQTISLRNIIYYLIEHERIDFPKKVQLVEILFLYVQKESEQLPIFQSIIHLLNQVVQYSTDQQRQYNVSTTLLFDTIRQVFVKESFKTIDQSLQQTMFDTIRHILQSQNINEDFKYKLFYSIKQETKIDKIIVSQIALQMLEYPFENYRYKLYLSQYLHTIQLLQQRHVEQLYTIAYTSSDEYCIADLADFLASIDQSLSSTLFDKIKWSGVGKKTFYANRQNIHSIQIDKSVKPFFNHLLNEDLDKYLPYDEITSETVFGEIFKLCNENQLGKVQRTIQRFVLDNNVYTDKYVTLLQLLFRCYFYIKVTKGNDSELLRRLIEELDEMADTCSTGHLVRLANIFSGFDYNMTMDVDEELKSCIFQRLTKIINSKSDADVEKIYEDPQSEVFMQVLSQDLVQLFKELEVEYVESNIISLNHLQESYRKHVTAFQTGE